MLALRLTFTFGDWKDSFELLSYVTVVLGLPAAIYQYRRSKIREQADREYGTYNALDEKYLDFQRMCFEHPQLDIFDIPDAQPRPLSEEEQKQELIAFTMLISVFERAYLMYHDQSNKVKAAQWTGWHEYICSYCERDNFRNAWEVSGETFDRNFENYVEDLMERSRLTAAAPRLPEAGATVASDDLQEIASVKDPRYLAALRLVGQYGWAGGTFNTNELSYLIQTSSSARTTRAFILARGARPIGLAVCSSIAPKLVIIHEMVVQQTITRDALFAHFWSILHPQIERSFGPTHCLVAEVPKNDPRHLKTEVFARGLSSAGFTATAWPYYLPSGFNSRSTPSLAQLAIRAPEVSRQLFLDIVNHLYSALYRSLWSNMTPAPGEFDAELHRLEALIVKDLDAS